MEKSIWAMKNNIYPSLKEDKNCDILIVGGGLTGISTCYYLKDKNYKVCLIEQNKVLNSTSLKTTAKLTYLQQNILSKIKSAINEKTAKNYLDSQIEAINNIIDIISTEKIECDLEPNDSYLFTMDNNIKKLIEEYNLYKKFNINAKLTKKLPIDIPINLGFKVPNTYVFHPLKYGNGLLNSINKNKNIEIYEETRMINFKKLENGYEILLNNKNKIKCKYLVIANHYPSFLFPYLFPIRTHVEKDNVICEKSKNLKFNAINIDKNVLSIRFYKDYIIKVTNSNKLNVKTINKNDNLKKNITYKYNNYDVITEDGLPIIGKIDKNMYLATGYNTWGMTNSNLAGKIITNIIDNKDDKYIELFNPHRFISIYKIVNLIIDNINNIKNFIESKIFKRDKATIKYINNKKYGVYIDKNNIEHIVKLTCPHMKCGLHFNYQEKTWDCPCHGSKFSIDGDIIRGPSTTCIKKIKTIN